MKHKFLTAFLLWAMLAGYCRGQGQNRVGVVLAPLVSSFVQYQPSGTTINFGVSTTLPTGSVTNWGNNITITPGNTLTVKGTLNMPEDKRIVVQRGAKLIVDGGTITNTCGNRWGGIEVWGNTDVSKRHQLYFNDTYNNDNLPPLSAYETAAIPLDGPGMVVLKNNATLQNGPLGTIITDRSGGYYPNHYGGIVVADNATFLNCKKGVGFMAYRYENYSYLKNCRFVSNNQNLPNAKFEGITVWACKGIVVDNCTFDYQTTPEPTNTNARVGIIATDHQNLIVRNGCQFKQLQQGIQLGASNYLHGDATITDNLFSNNTAGITNLSTMQLNASENTFASNTPTQQGLTIGIALTGTCGYAISNNSFSNMLAGTAAWFTSHDTPGNNQIDCNTYTNCQWGNYLNDNNSGLQLINNDFATQTADNRLDKGTNNGAIAFSQGDFTTPYFNLFSTNPATQHFKANPTQTDLFVYFYHTDNINYAPEVNARLVPRCDITSNCTPPNNFVNVKIDFEGTYTGCLDLNGDGYAGMLPPNIDDCQTKECYYAVKSYLNNLKSEIDGGDKADLLNSIYNSPEALATYQKYMTASPYLSDEVLLQAAQAELMSPNYRANILLANAPLSDEVMYQIQDIVAANVYQLLYTIKYYTKFSARDNLNMSISSESAKKEKLLRTLIAKFADERDYAQLDEILTAENTTYAVRALLSSKIEREQFANAQTMLTYLPATTPDEQDYKTIQQINLQRLSATTQGFELSEQQYQALRNIAAAYGTQAPAAQTLLALLRGEYFEWQIPNETESSKTDTHPRYKDVALLGKEVLNRLSVTPNPANNSINVQLPNYLSEQPAVLNIYNLSGKLFATINTNKEQSTTTISTTDLPNGVYLISYTADGITLSSAKVVVQH